MLKDSRQTPSAPSKVIEIPPDLADELAELLAQALVAELMESAKSAKTQAERDATVASPPGHDRSHPGLEARVRSHER